MGAVLITAYTILSLTKPLPMLKGKPLNYTKAAGDVMVTWPGGVEAAVGAEDKIFTSAASEPKVPFASINKAVTALAIVKKKPLGKVVNGIQMNDFTGETITFGPADEALYNLYVAKGGSVVRVKNGDRLTEYQALQALLMASGNNYADSLVQWAFGSMDAYTAFANDMLREYGITNTTIKEASGFDDLSTSTASDIIKIGKKLKADPGLSQIVGLNEATLPTVGKIYNTNELIVKNSAVGIKTGHTNGAGYCLLLAEPFYAEGGKANETLYSVVLGAGSSQESFALSSQLLRSFWEGNYGRVVVAKKGAAFATYTAPWGADVTAVAKEDIVAHDAKFLTFEAVANTENVAASAKGGAVTGDVRGRNFTPLTGKPVELVLTKDIPKPSVWWRLTHYF